MFTDDKNSQQPQNTDQQKVESNQEGAKQTEVGKTPVDSSSNSDNKVMKSATSAQPEAPKTQRATGSIDPTHLAPPTLSGSGAAFAPTKPNPDNSTTSKQNENQDGKQLTPSNKKIKRKKSKKTPLIILSILLLVAFGGGFYYLTEMTREAEVPTTPTSEPAADEVEPEAPCTLFYSLFLDCGQKSCETSADCEQGLECVRLESETAKKPSDVIVEVTREENSDYEILALSSQDHSDVLLLVSYRDETTQEFTDPDFYEPGDYTYYPESYVWHWTISGEKEIEGTPQFYSDVPEKSLNPVGYCSDPQYTDVCATDPGYEACCTAPLILECGESGCETDENCEGDLVCVESDDGDNYCAIEELEDACAANPSTMSCCDQLACGEPDCQTDSDCLNDLVCLAVEVEDEVSGATRIDTYCAEEEFEDACSADPTYETCCEAPGPTTTPTSTPTASPSATLTPTDSPDATSTPTDSPQATNTPQPTQPPYSTPLPTQPGQPQTYAVDTQPECNDECEANADCKNISHICYNGRCRLDINPEDEFCRTPAGETIVERIVETPVAGPQEWLEYLKVGIGAIGAGLLLLLLL